MCWSPGSYASSMPTRKQKRREAKSKRHDYEFVYLDEEGNEVEPPPEAPEPAARQRPSSNGGKPAAAGKPARGGRARRTPQPPSWQRAARRALILGAVVFVLFSLNHGKKGASYTSAAGLAVLYTALFIPFTYMIDRFAYRRFQAREDGGASTRQAKKR